MCHLPKQQILDSSELKEFSDKSFKFDEHDRKFFKLVEKKLWERRHCLLGAISPFPTVFSKDLYCRNVKTRACLGKGLTLSQTSPGFYVSAVHIF